MIPNCNVCDKEMEMQYKAGKWTSYACRNTKCLKFDKLEIVENNDKN